MGYVIVAIIVVLIVAGGVGFFVSGAARRSNVSNADDPRAIVGTDDESPLGSTSQHAEPEGNPDAPEPGTEDRPDVARPVIGGEGEGRREIPH
jgi:hypothetical protein